MKESVEKFLSSVRFSFPTLGEGVWVFGYGTAPSLPAPLELDK